MWVLRRGEPGRVCVNPPAEHQLRSEEHLCGHHMKAIHGTRNMAQNWRRKFSETVHALGVVTGKISPCQFHHVAWQACGLVHRADFVFVGTTRNLKRVTEHIGNKLKIMVATTGPDDRVRRCSRTAAAFSGLWRASCQSDQGGVDKLIG